MQLLVRPLQPDGTSAEVTDLLALVVYTPRAGHCPFYAHRVSVFAM